MNKEIFIPYSLRAARRHVHLALKASLPILSKSQFLHAWHSLAYLYPGRHPDGYEHPESGWPQALKRVAAEAWRRAEAGQLSDNELYCYQASKARILRERKDAERKWPWLFRDHFSV